MLMTPQPKFSSLFGNRIDANNKTVFQIDYDEHVLYNMTNDQYASLDELFTITYYPLDRNLSYIDIVYDVNAGRLFIIGEVVNFTEPLLVSIESRENSVIDMVGNPSLGTLTILNLALCAAFIVFFSLFLYSPTGCCVCILSPLLQAPTSTSRFGRPTPLPPCWGIS
jgi:hypothetical protein